MVLRLDLACDKKSPVNPAESQNSTESVQFMYHFFHDERRQCRKKLGRESPVYKFEDVELFEHFDSNFLCPAQPTA